MAAEEQEPIGPCIRCIAGSSYRLVDGAGATVSVVRRYLAHRDLPEGWYIETTGRLTLAHYIGTEDTARQVIVAQAAVLGLAGIRLP